MEHRPIIHTGYLRLVEYETDHHVHSRWQFESDQGKSFRVVDPSDAPINTYISITVERRAITAWELADAPSAETTDPVKKHFALVEPIYPGDEITPGMIAVMEERCDLVIEHYKTLSQGKWDVQCKYYFVEDEYQSRSLLGFTYNRHMNTILAEYPGYVPNYFVGFGGFKSGINGEAYVGTNRCWIYGTGTWRTLIHEIGHCLGRGHATFMSEYGDLGSFMGKGVKGWNAVDYKIYELLRPGHIEFSTFGSYFLAPLETEDSELYAGEIKVLYADTSEGPVAISTRKPHNQHINGYGNDQVVWVHKHDPNHANGYRSTLLTSLRVGESYLVGATIIHVLSIKQGTVCVGLDSNVIPEFPTKTSMQGLEVAEFANGIWETRGHEFQGMDLYYLGKEGQDIVGWWYTHTVEGYKKQGVITPGSKGRDWFYLEGTWNGRVVDVVISKPDGPDMRQVGQGTIRFDSENRAVFRYYTEQYGRDTITLNRFTSTRSENISGLYETGTREGITVGVYYYETEDENTVNTVSVFQFLEDDWYIMLGVYGENPIQLTVYEPRCKYKSVLSGELFLKGSAVLDTDANRLHVGDTVYNLSKIF